MSLLGAVAGDQLALNTIKYDIVHNTNIFLPLTLIFGGLAYYSLSNMIRKRGIGITNASWNVLSTSCGVFIGFLIWGEQVSMKQMIGCIFGIVSLYLMDGTNLKEDLIG